MSKKKVVCWCEKHNTCLFVPNVLDITCVDEADDDDDDGRLCSIVMESFFFLLLFRIDKPNHKKYVYL